MTAPVVNQGNFEILEFSASPHWGISMEWEGVAEAKPERVFSPSLTESQDLVVQVQMSDGSHLALSIKNAGTEIWDFLFSEKVFVVVILDSTGKILVETRLETPDY